MSGERMTAEKWFPRGLQFEEAAQHVEYFDLHFPAICNRAFACECFLKCLAMIEVGLYVPAHALDRLFNGISAKSQRRLERWWTRRELPNGKLPGVGLPDELKPLLPSNMAD